METRATLQQVARVAGVSASTVSRVLNSSNLIANSTAEAVRRAAEALKYKPSRRARASSSSAASLVAGKQIGFFIIQPRLRHPIPAYMHLLRGVSTGCGKFDLNLHVGFLDSEENPVRGILQYRLDGLIVHGTPPVGESAKALYSIPTVWLMGGRARPTWGDQIMPDNGLVGQIAGQYLLRKGHRNVAYCGFNGSWFMRIRCVSFEQAIEDAGGEVLVLNESPAGLDATELGHRLVQKIRSAVNPPTGLFIAEDWLLRPIYPVLQAAGIVPGRDLEIISCNNEPAHLLGLAPIPATIDIHFERIGQLGVEHLVQRLQGNSFSDRVRIMIEPSLVLPGDKQRFAQMLAAQH